MAAQLDAYVRLRAARRDGGSPLQPHEMPLNIGVFAPAPETGGGLCWARIYTTSPNVVVSAWVTNEVPDPPITTFYFSPGDFKVFEVPHFHFPPVPVGPGLGAAE